MNCIAVNIEKRKHFALDFLCNNGTTIPSKKFCDGVEDCDGSDETPYGKTSIISPFLK